MFERLVFNHLYQYLVSNNLLIEKNSGYKKHDSTICQLLLLCDKIYKGIDEQKEVRVVFLDASKAFDRVWHAGLLFKLRQLGLTSSLVTWIQSYLSDHKQRVVLEGCSSSWLPVKAGVPQGSILGPLLFLVYTNDITDDITSDIHLYCDDTSLLSVATDPVVAAQRLNDDLNTLYKWSKHSFMVFNPSKTVSLTINNISKNHDIQPLMLENTLVSEVGEHTHLGVTFSKNMSWKAHINNLCKKASQRLGMMQVLKYSLSRDTLAHIYTAVVLSLFDYGDVIYNNCTSGSSHSLELLHLRAARIETGAITSTNTERLLREELGWEKLIKRRERHKVSLFHKILLGSLPQYLTNLVPFTNSQATTYCLRNRTDYPDAEQKDIKLASFHLWLCHGTTCHVILEAASPAQFKALFRRQFCPVTPPKYYSSYKVSFRRLGMEYTRLRLKSNLLNRHKFKLGFSDSPNCECGNHKESEKHYLLSCVRYSAERQAMIQTVSSILTVSNLNTDFLDRPDEL